MRKTVSDQLSTEMVSSAALKRILSLIETSPVESTSSTKSLIGRAFQMSSDVLSSSFLCLVIKEDNLYRVQALSRNAKASIFEEVNSIGTGMVKRVFKEGQLLSVHTLGENVVMNGAFEKQFNSADKFDSHMCAPLATNNVTMGALWVAVPELKPGSAALVNAIASAVMIVLEREQLLQQHLEDNIMAASLLRLAQARCSNDSFVSILDRIVETVYTVVEAEFVSLFICDNHRRELTLIASKDGFHGLTMSFGEGIAGHVASTCLSIRIDDCYRDDRFDSKMDMVAGHKTRSMLCVPVLGSGSSCNSAIAVIQALNKKSRLSFRDQDEKNLLALASEVSKIFKDRILDVKTLACLTSRNDRHHLEEGLFREYGSSALNRFKIGADLKLESVLHEFSEQEDEFLIIPLTPVLRSKSYMQNALQVNDWDLDPFLMEEDELIQLLFFMLHEFNIIKLFSLNKKKLVAFLTAVKSKYRKNKFHNVRHAFGVVQFAFMLLKQGAAQYLTNLEILALLLSAFCHDIDHPGHTK